MLQCYNYVATKRQVVLDIKIIMTRLLIFQGLEGFLDPEIPAFVF